MTSTNPTYNRIKPKMNAFTADFKAFCEKHDLDFKRVRVVCDMFGEVKFTVQTKDRKISANTPRKEAEVYKARCWEFDLKPEWLGKTITFQNAGTYKIVGLQPRKRKNKVMLENMNGRPATCSAASVKILMKEVA